jgi:hypothetical protein
VKQHMQETAAAAARGRALRRMVDVARRAPSVHNTQPWLWTIQTTPGAARRPDACARGSGPGGSQPRHELRDRPAPRPGRRPVPWDGRPSWAPFLTLVIPTCWLGSGCARRRSRWMQRSRWRLSRRAAPIDVASPRGRSPDKRLRRLARRLGVSGRRWSRSLIPGRRLQLERLVDRAMEIQDQDLRVRMEERCMDRAQRG